MKKSIFYILTIAFLSLSAFSLSVDIKTKFAEKSEITAIKVGATYILEKQGIKVVNIGEDFAVWLKNIERRFVSENKYAYTITVTLSYPTSLVEKATIKQETLKFGIELNLPVKNQDDGFDKYLSRHLFKVKERLKYEAYIGGMAVAVCINELLEAVGALKDK